MKAKSILFTVLSACLALTLADQVLIGNFRYLIGR